MPLDKVFCKSAGGRLIWKTFGSGVLLVMKRLLCQKALLSQAGDGHGVFGSIFCWKKATVLSPFHPAH